jgi:hypothetical protein
MRFARYLVFLTVLLSLGCAGGNSDLEFSDDADQENQSDEPIPDLSKAESDLLNGFVDPQLTEAEQQAVLARYAFVDVSAVVPKKLLNRALVYFDANKERLANQRYITIIDFASASMYPRFFIVNMETGAVQPLHTAHGSGSDRDNDGVAERFSNEVGSNASSLGFYRTAETYNGKHGRSMRLDGLSATNSNVRKRAVVLHGARYVYDSNKKAGRSWGCPAVSMAVKDEVINKLKQGSLMYAGRSQD